MVTITSNNEEISYLSSRVHGKAIGRGHG